MKGGYAPIGPDGKQINLHHVLGKEPGPMVEIVSTAHKQYHKQLHGLIENGGSFRNTSALDRQYNKFRKEYWKLRSLDFMRGHYMSDVKNLVEHLNNNAHDEIYWLGACDKSQVDVLEKKLVLLLPSEFKEFLLLVGGGGVIDEEISGIVDNDALADSGGSIYYDTCYCRDEYSLPLDMAVIYFKNDDVCWCIDCRKDTYGRVINYDLFSRKRCNIIASSFSDFFKEYVNLRT